MKWRTILFLWHVKVVCWWYKIELRLLDTPHIVFPEGNCVGYFSDDDRVLVVATGCSEEKWLGVLVHELCHLHQWVEDCPAWKNCSFRGDNSNNLMDAWLLRKVDLEPNMLKRVIYAIQDMEMNCEQRAWRLIKRFNLSIDPQRYIQEANAYVWQYYVVRKLCLWSQSGRHPARIKEIVDKMPTHFMKYYEYAEMDDEMFALYKRKSFDPN